MKDEEDMANVRKSGGEENPRGEEERPEVREKNPHGGHERSGAQAGNPRGAEEGPGAGPSAARRALRACGIVLLCVAGVLLALIAALNVAPLRRAILNYAIPGALERAPGDLTVDGADWPALGTLEFTGVSWRVDGTEALSADTVAVSVSLWPLVSKDVKASLLLARGLRMDVPAIQGLMAGGEPPAPDEESRGGFPRPGGVPGVPSVAVDSISIEATHIGLGDGREITGVTITGGFDFSAGGSGMIRIDSLTARGPQDTWNIERFHMLADLDEGTLAGGGAGDVGPGFPIVFSVEPSGTDMFTLVLTRERGLNPPKGPGVLAEIGLGREGGRVMAVGFDIALRTPSTHELSRIPALAERVSSLPVNEGIAANVRGRATLRPSFGVEAHTVVREVPGIERAMLAMTYAGRTAGVDSLAVLLDSGVAVSTAARVEMGDGIRVSLEPLMLEFLDPEGPAARSRWKPAGRMPGTVTYSGETGGLEFAGLEVTGDFGDATIGGELDGQMSGSVDLAAVWAEPPPILLSRAGAPGTVDSLRAAWSADAPYSLTGNARLLGTDAGREVTAAFSMVLPGPRNLSPLIPGGGGGAGDLSDLGPLEGEAGLRLVTGAAPAEFDLNLDLGRTAWIDTAAASIRARGDSMEMDEFLIRIGALRVAITGIYNTAGGAGHARATASDAGFLRRLSPSVPDFSLKAAADFVTAGSVVTVEGAAVGGGVAGGQGAHQAASGARGAPPVAHDTGAAGENGRRGSQHSLAGLRRLDAAVEGEVRGAAYAIPGIEAYVRYGPEGSTAQVRLPQGLVSEYVLLDRAALDVVSESPGAVLPASVAISAAGKRYEFRQKGRLSAGDTIVCDVDTLRLVAYGDDIQAREPFRVALDRPANTLLIDGMYLAGSLGEVRADGFVGRDSMEIFCGLLLELPEAPPPGLRLPRGAWPSRVQANLDITAADAVEMDATVDGLMLDDGSTASLDFALNTGGGRIASNMTMDAGGRRLLYGTLSFPAHLRVYPPGLDYHEGDVSVDISLTRYPVLMPTEEGGVSIRSARGGGAGGGGDLTASVDANITVSGPAGAPAAFFSAGVSFPDWPDLADFNVAAEGAVRPASLRDDSLRARAGDLARRVAAALGIAGTGDMVAELTVNRAGHPLLTGNLSYPLALSFDPIEVGTGDGMLNASLRSDSLPLEDFDLLMPSDVGMAGLCRLELTAAGKPSDPSISGGLEMTGLSVKHRQMIDLTLDGKAEAAGTAMAPLITGEFTIRGGIINLPKKPESLHPVEGPSVLLDTALRARRDSLLQASPAAGPPLEPSTPPEKPRFTPDYDITLDITRGMWLRGEGLEVELDGKLEINQKHNKPVLAGEMAARRGTFLFLGRVFDLERGTISFYGEDEINPSLDITVTTAIEDYKAIITLGGTLKKPELTLTSSPELSEGDIMAMVLFGKPIDELDEGQGNMLKDRAADVLLTMGAAKLQQSIAAETGIDVVSVRSARGEGDQGAALVVGKYITPELLLTYEQALKEKSTSYVVLEYMVSRYIKLETLYSNQNRSGVGISTEKDY